MARRYLKRPAILVDPRMHRIRIYKYTLHLLGDPKHILLIVDPYAQSVTIMRSEKSDKRACCLERTLPDNNRSPEIFCRSLIRDLFELNECWDKSQPYRVYGTFFSDGCYVKFNLMDSTVFLGEREWQR